MRINALRSEVAAILASHPTERPPAIRRSSRTEWIYVTDILMLLPGEEHRQLLKELSGNGWEYADERGWIQLRKAAEEPPENWFGGPFGPEAARCLSLLERHPGEAKEERTTAQAALIKAGEEGEKAYDLICANLHREWAGRLRMHQSLPALSRAYFGG